MDDIRRDTKLMQGAMADLGLRLQSEMKYRPLLRLRFERALRAVDKLEKTIRR